MRTLAILAVVAASMGAVQTQHAVTHSDDLAGVFGPASNLAGVDAAKVTRHVLIAPDGGSIEVKAKTASDAVTLAAIRAELPHLSERFKSGQFSSAATHTVTHSVAHSGTTLQPPATDMSRVKDLVAFAYAETPAGGRVTATTSDPEALNAVYLFLRSFAGNKQNGDTWDVAGR